MMQGSRPGRTALELSSGREIFLRTGDTLTVAAEHLARSGFPMLPVCNGDRRLVGSITQSAVLEAFGGGLTGERPLSEVMNSDPPVIADYAGPEWVLTEMIDALTWSLPVIDADDRLVAVITLHDLAPVVGAALLADSWLRITRPRR